MSSASPSSRTTDARAIIANSRHEEYKHFAMDLEFLFRKRPEWAAIAKGILFQDGDITENAEGAEENAGIDDPGPDSGPRLMLGSLGIGGLR